MIVPGALLRDPAFVAMSLAARGAYFGLALYLWESGSLPEADLAALSGAGAEWPEIRDALAPLFSRRGGRWSLSWLNRYAERVAVLRESGTAGAAATNSKRKALRGSADGVAPTARTHFLPTGSGSGSGFGSGSGSGKEEASFRPGLLAELQSQHRTRDIAGIASKLLERHRSEPVRDLNLALHRWVETAEAKDIDRLLAPAPAETPGESDPLARITADEAQALRDHARDPEAAARARAAVSALVAGVAHAAAMPERR